MISTTDIQTGSGKSSTPKVLTPGNRVIKINEVFLNKVPWSEDGYYLMLNCESDDLGENFEGFYIDKENPSAGRYKGQIGRIRTSRWLFEDKQVGDITFNRDLEILKHLKYICEATNCQEWLTTQDNKHETIESLVTQFNTDKPFKGKFLRTCIGGKEYENAQGYTNYDLYFPKFAKGAIPFESADVEEGLSQVAKFSETEHILKPKPKTVDEFNAAPAEVDDFDLD